MKTSAKTITGAMAAEAALAKKEAEEFEEAIDSLPEDHPLKLEAAKQKQIMGGDLAGLPPGHPLLQAMEAARARYEAEEGQAEEEAAAAAEREEIKIRHAKKLDAKKAKAEQRQKEEEREGQIRTAAKVINSSMDETVDALKRLNDNIIASQEDFAADRYALKKLERLQRVVVAAMRGVSSSKLNAGRVVANG